MVVFGLSLSSKGHIPHLLPSQSIDDPRPLYAPSTWSVVPSTSTHTTTSNDSAYFRRSRPGSIIIVVRCETCSLPVLTRRAHTHTHVACIIPSAVEGGARRIVKPPAIQYLVHQPSPWLNQITHSFAWKGKRLAKSLGIISATPPSLSRSFARSLGHGRGQRRAKRNPADLRSSPRARHRCFFVSAWKDF